jgi:hypothetical protein
VGLVQIYYEDGTYKMDGRQFDSGGVWTGWFRTEISRYDERSLIYKYRALRPDIDEDSTGHGEYNFSSKADGNLTHFYGHFYEDERANGFILMGSGSAFICRIRKTGQRGWLQPRCQNSWHSSLKIPRPRCQLLGSNDRI